MGRDDMGGRRPIQAFIAFTDFCIHLQNVISGPATSALVEELVRHANLKPDPRPTNLTTPSMGTGLYFNKPFR